MVSKPTIPNDHLLQYQDNKEAETVNAKFRWAYLKWKHLYIFFYPGQNRYFPALAGSDSLECQLPFNSKDKAWKTGCL